MRKPPRDDAQNAHAGHLLTVKEYADVVRQHPKSVYRRIREGRQPGLCRVGGTIRLTPPHPHDD